MGSRLYERGKCCLFKLEDEDSGEIYYTNVVCRYFDKEHCRCNCYQELLPIGSDLPKLTKDNDDKIGWMPQSCAYRRLAEGKGLPEEHPLLNNGQMAEEHTIKNYCVSELEIDENDLEDHIIEDWDDQ